MNKFVVARKRREHAQEESPRYYEYWNGDNSWGDYAVNYKGRRKVICRKYNSKDVAMSIAESLAQHSEYVYLVIEVDEDDFVEMEYWV